MQLLNAGASVRSCSTRKEGGTPLHEAVSCQQMRIIDLLFHRASANPFAENYFGALQPLLQPLPCQLSACQEHACVFKTQLRACSPT